MAGTLTFRIVDGRPGENQARLLRNELQIRAERNGIKLPKKISIGGSYYYYFEISWNTNAARDLILEIAQDMKLTLKIW